MIIVILVGVIALIVIWYRIRVKTTDADHDAQEITENAQQSMEDQQSSQRDAENTEVKADKTLIINHMVLPAHAGEVSHAFSLELRGETWYLIHSKFLARKSGIRSREEYPLPDDFFVGMTCEKLKEKLEDMFPYSCPWGNDFEPVDKDEFEKLCRPAV